MKNAMRFLFAALFAVGSLTAADLTITFQSKAAKTEGLETHYYSATHHRTNNEATKTDSLVDYQSLTTYTINHDKKLIQKLSFEDALAAMESAQSDMPEGMSAMMGGLFGDPSNCKVEELGSEVVAGRKCKKYKITVGKILFESSNDPTLVPPVPAASFAKMMKAKGALTLAMGPMGKSMAKLYEELSKIKGLALKTNMSGFMGMKAATEATKVVEGPVPASVFALPTGYKTEDLGKQMRESKAKK
ncbi:MAG: hypothetical protein IPN59_10455 [Holophaga sp.]|nr:hypothetical protein [Holophaga sp.]